MSRLWYFLFLGGGLAWSGGAAGLGAVIRIDLGTIDHAVSTALNGSDVLQKITEGDAKKEKPDIKPIKGISGLKVKGFRPPVISLALSPGSGIVTAVLVQMTITGERFIGGNMEITLAAKLMARGHLGQDITGTPRVSPRNCHIALIRVRTNLPSVQPKVMSKVLHRTLQKVLPALNMLVLDVPVTET